VGLRLKNLFDEMGLQSFAKTSGSKGLQVYVPLNTAVSYDETKPLAHAVARFLEDESPKEIVSDMKKVLRTGKIFVDWSQNDDHKTTICVYSLRARERPTVSTPVTWQEVESCLKKSDPTYLVFDSGRVLERIAAHGDLFAQVLKLKQKLPSLKALTESGQGGTTALKSRPTFESPRASEPVAKKRAGAASKTEKPKN